jgi:hypothetical protein
MTHTDFPHGRLVLAGLLEFGGGALAIAFLVAAVLWWRQNLLADAWRRKKPQTRRVAASVALVLGLASAGLSVYGRTYLSHARAVLCAPGNTRALCPGD